MYITSNDIDINFHVDKLPSLGCNKAYQEVVKNHLRKSVGEKANLNWLFLSVRLDLPKKHAKKRTIYLDAESNIIENTENSSND